MLIELEKYSKIDNEPFRITVPKHRDNRNNLINYGCGGLLLGIVLVSL